ncbi:hypothetical protein CAAN1_10S04390 [[Candida] anglica]|uniref:Gustatory receptor n=1 Tax=[Candida] anglica TaxID=148631 RepID=A0ABP0EHI2_9ASCO
MDRTFLVDTIVSYGLTAVAGWYYLFRYRNSKHILGVSDDMHYFTMSVITLAMWNEVLTIITSIAVSRPPSGETKSRIHYDLSFVFVTCISLWLYRAFSRTILMVVEYAYFLSQQKRDPYPKHQKGHRKTVSFNEKTLKYLYSDTNLSISDCSIPINPFHTSYLKRILRYCLVVGLIFCACVILIPSSLLGASTITIYENNQFHIKTDHILVALVGEYIIFSIHRFYQVMNHPQLTAFPKWTYIATSFTWLYACIVLISSLSCMVLFNDGLIIFNQIITNSSIQYESPSIFTSLFVDFILHSVTCDPEDFSQCENMAAKVDWIMTKLASSWLVLNFICFVALPLLIWVMVIEMKVLRNKEMKIDV